jgi:hypothetical protein
MCGGIADIQTKYLLDLPNVFAISITWIDNIEIAGDKDSIGETSK